MYGLIPKNYQNNREKASKHLLNASFVSEEFAKKELNYFRVQAQNFRKF
ncbi:hypothetical protein M23134_08365 [Microscilla marina ATCC 23134]|uniref:Uncharacterized protein n=2 Tax=Microscilla marina TaxID=1027 RepID=A1ZR02_MICM2|nr:hypothetical protein M23134_08365 [Microscilla marina ATCC 23134]